MIKSFYLLIPCVLLCLVAEAQINESDTVYFQFRAGATGAWQQGNVDLLVIRGRLEIVANGNRKVVFKTQNNSLYQEFANRKADNDINSRNFLYWKPQNKYYPFAMAYAQTNFRRKIDYRFFGGIGGTWQLLQNQDNTIKLSTSIIWEETSFAIDQFNESFYNGNERISLWRGTIYLAGYHNTFGKKIRLFYNAYWQPSLAQTPNNRAQVDVGLELPVLKGLNFLMEYIYNYEQVVAIQVDKRDGILTFGISYKFVQ